MNLLMEILVVAYMENGYRIRFYHSDKKKEISEQIKKVNPQLKNIKYFL